MRVLIIDDSEDDRLLYRRALQKDTRRSYEILEAHDGETGLKQLQEITPECILLDYSLPGHNGIEVLKRIRAQHDFVPVVMMTGQGNEAIAVRAIHEGAQNYLTKSAVIPETLQHVIDSAIEHCRMEQRIHDQRAALQIFTRALAHDLKEPIRTIKSFMDLLRGHKTFSEEETSYFHFIENAAIRMGDLVETVYFYTRLEGAAEQVTEEVCNVNEVLQEAQENIKQLMDESQAIVTSDELPKVYMNRTHLRQVLQNLLCNAIRHCDEQPKIHMHAEKQNNDWLLQVVDNGSGVPEDYREQIFEPFRRMGSNKDKEHGLGLGLAVCKKIVESYGGKIWHEPGVEKGSIFIVTLRPDPAGATMEALTALADIKPANTSAAADSIARIMLVEDNEADIKLTKILLIDKEKLQCDLVVARDGMEALEMLQTENPAGNLIDLLLLDINMPRMDGFSLLEKMQAQQSLRGIPVVMCSTSNDDKDIERAKALGAIGYLSKPPRMDKLRPIIDQLPNIHLQQADNGQVLMRAA